MLQEALESIQKSINFYKSASEKANTAATKNELLKLSAEANTRFKEIKTQLNSRNPNKQTIINATKKESPQAKRKQGPFNNEKLLQFKSKKQKIDTPDVKIQWKTELKALLEELKQIKIENYCLNDHTNKYELTRYKASLASNFAIDRIEKLSVAKKEFSFSDKENLCRLEEALNGFSHAIEFYHQDSNLLQDEEKVRQCVNILASTIKRLTTSLTKFNPPTRQRENEDRSREARDRRALTGEAGSAASRRQVIVGDADMNPVRDECASDAGRSRPNDSRVMRTNFKDTSASSFPVDSDSLMPKYCTRLFFKEISKPENCVKHVSHPSRN